MDGKTPNVTCNMKDRHSKHVKLAYRMAQSNLLLNQRRQSMTTAFQLLPIACPSAAALRRAAPLSTTLYARGIQLEYSNSLYVTTVVERQPA